MVNLLPSLISSIIEKACVSWPLDSLIAWSLDSLIPSPVSCLPLIPGEVEKAAHVGDAFARDGGQRRQFNSSPAVDTLQ